MLALFHVLRLPAGSNLAQPDGVGNTSWQYPTPEATFVIPVSSRFSDDWARPQEICAHVLCPTGTVLPGFYLPPVLPLNRAAAHWWCLG